MTQGQGIALDLKSQSKRKLDVLLQGFRISQRRGTTSKKRRSHFYLSPKKGERKAGE
jgi:hypothetical protein